jgi:hypothetical protein
MWMDRPELPLDRYGDLANQADQKTSDIANQDGGDWEIGQEEFIAACMKEAGFTYYPREIEAAAETEDGRTGLVRAGRRLWIPWLPDSLTEVERYGYGYSRPTEIIDNAAAAEQTEPEPNDEYVAALSLSAQNQYMIALMGKEMAEYDLLSDVDSVPLPDLGGCMGGAEDAHPYPLPQALAESPTTAYRDLLDQMNEQGWPYSEGYLGGAELEALDAAWRECFQADFPPVSFDVLPGTTFDGVDYVPSELDGPTSAWDLAFYTNSEGEYWDGGPEGKAAPAGYESLSATPREIAIAVADFKCRQETEYLERFLGIQRQAQEEFIAAHQAELNEMAAAMGDYINR